MGPLWITVSMVIVSVSMTLVYGALFGVPTREYAVFVVCGMIAWIWLSGILTEGGNTFFVYASYIRAMPIDKAQFVWTVAFRQMIVLGHNLVVYLGLVALGLVDLNRYTLLFIPSVALLFVMSIPLVLVLSILFVRYRDFQKLVTSSLIVIIMLTPIFWQPHLISGWRRAFVHYNPFFYAIELIRAPLSGYPVSLTVYLVCLGMTALLWLWGWQFYRRYERFVIYWT